MPEEKVVRETDVYDARPEALGSERPTTAEIAHLIFDPFRNPFMDRDFENDW